MFVSDMPVNCKMCGKMLISDNLNYLVRYCNSCINKHNFFKNKHNADN